MMIPVEVIQFKSRPSAYAQYLREKTDDEIIENETGFATYRYWNEKQVYIIDIFVYPKYRKHGNASAFANEIAVIAKKAGRSEMIGSVSMNMKDRSTSAKVLLSYGMEPFSALNGVILFKKDI